jgi:hypothetical protein
MSTDPSVAGPQSESAVTSHPPTEARSARLVGSQEDSQGPLAGAPAGDEPPHAVAGAPVTNEAQHASAGSPVSDEARAGVARGPVLDAARRGVLRAVLNRIVPAYGALAGAGDLGVGDSIERTLGESARLRRLFLDGLTEIAVTAVDFVELEADRQVSVLQSIEKRWPEFFAALVEHAYRGYYTLPAVQRAVGFEPRPPQPLGHQLPPFDPAVLDLQRQRAPFWRQTS